MTREEAIKTIKGDAWFCCVEKYREALDVAIEALEQQPVLDKIRAEIEQLRLHKSEFITNDGKVCIDSQEVLNVIDKYKAEGSD